MSNNPAILSSDIDVYCLHCGYNLRGQSGDPRRCPECGKFNPMGDATLPAPLISAQLKEMETAPAMCLLCLLVGGGCLLLIVLSQIVAFKKLILDGDLTVCFLVPMAGCLILWPLFCLSFRRSCLRKTGWKSALLRYHLFGILTVMVAFGPGIAILKFGAMGLPWFSGLESHAGVVIAVVAAGVFIVFVWAELVGISWCYAQARSEMEPLQREVAVTVARDVLRRQLMKGTRRSGFLK